MHWTKIKWAFLILYSNSKYISKVINQSQYKLTLAKHQSKHYKLIYSFDPHKAYYHYLKDENTVKVAKFESQLQNLYSCTTVSDH